MNISVKKTFIIAMTAASLALVPLFGCAKDEPKADFSGIDAICELATLQCYYHNVAESTVNESGPLGGLLKTGYKRLWIEYSGVVDVGINVDEVTINVDDANGVVKVHVPDAKILNITLDKKSISKPLFETGFLTHISADEKTTAMAAAQDNMEQTAKENTTMLKQAYQRAKEVIEGYVVNVGRVVGREYRVEWV